MIKITEFPTTLLPEEDYSFSFEGANYNFRPVYPHVFHESEALGDHLGRTSRGVYDGLEILPSQELAPEN